jgi:uncharacterized metal-binding protein YceD (DUF177 family)
MKDRFAHHLRLDQIRDGDRLALVADEAERHAIADRLGLGRLDRLEANVNLSRDGGTVRAAGRLVANVEQHCVVTNEPVPAHVDEPFELMFRPGPDAVPADDEVELGAEDCDVTFYDGDVIDLGTAVGDTLALSIDPYPRSASAEAALKEAGVMTEEQAGPFAALAALKKDREP